MAYSNIENLGFTGGSVKGTAYVGVAKALQDTGLMSNIKRVSGVSAGSIFATFLALGFSPEEMRNVMLELDYKKLAGIDDHTFSFLGIILNLPWLWKYRGISSGDYFYNWMHNLIEKKTGNGNITFGEAHNVGKYLDIYTVSYNVNTESTDIFSYEHTPDVKIVDAVRASMSIPLLFRPFTIEGFEYVDGGTVDNYPIELFDHINYQANFQQSEGYYYNGSTLGFALASPNKIESYKNPNTSNKVKTVSTDTTQQFLKAILSAVWEGAQLKELQREFNRTVYINNRDIGFLEFDLSLGDKMELIKEGYIATINYINEHCTLGHKIENNQDKLDMWINNGNHKYYLNKIIDYTGIITANAYISDIFEDF